MDSGILHLIIVHLVLDMSPVLPFLLNLKHNEEQYFFHLPQNFRVSLVLLQVAWLGLGATYSI